MNHDFIHPLRVRKKNSSHQSEKSFLLQKENWLYAYQKLYRKPPSKFKVKRIESTISQLKESILYQDYPPPLLSDLLQAKLFFEVISHLLVRTYTAKYPIEPYLNSRDEFLSLIVEKGSETTWFYVGQIVQELETWKKHFQKDWIPAIHDSYVKEFLESFLSKTNDQRMECRSFLKKLMHLSLIEMDRYFTVSMKECQSLKKACHRVPFFYARYQTHFIIGYRSKKQVAMVHVSSKLRQVKDKLPFITWDGKLYHRGRIDLLDYELRIMKNDMMLLINKPTLRSLVHRYGNLDQYTFSHRKALVHQPELEIIRTYNKELIEIAKRFYMADNFYQVEKVCYFARTSFIKTIALKRKTSSKRVMRQLKNNKKREIGIRYHYGEKECWCRFITFKDLRRLQREMKNR